MAHENNLNSEPQSDPAEQSADLSSPLADAAPVAEQHNAHASEGNATAELDGGSDPVRESTDAEPAVESTESTDSTESTEPTGTASKSVSFRAAATVAVVCAVVGGIAGGAMSAIVLGGNSVTAVPSTVTVNDTGSVSNTTGVAATAMNSVVTIEVSADSTGGSGSGVIVSEDGYIVTNNHVASIGAGDKSATIRVTLADGRLFEATVVGTDPILDLAVLKIDATGLAPIEFADSDALNVGDNAIAIGAPLGLAGTVTEGIISALNRSISISASGDEGFNFDVPGSETVTVAQDLSLPVIQTDASINPGNSGGALLDSEGRLIGINVAIASLGSSGGSGGNIGVGFALPSNLVQRIVDSLIADGSATHGRIGAMVGSVTDNTGVVGAVVSDVESGSAAAQAGLVSGDIVTSFGGVPVRDQVDLTAQVRSHAPGDTVDMVVIRDGEQVALSITLGSLG